MTEAIAISDLDEQIAKLLREGVSHREIVEQLPVQYGDVTHVRAAIGLPKGARPAPEKPPPRIDRKAEPAPVTTRVPCIVTGAEIGARECISRQTQQHCFCPKASFAINALVPLVLPGTRLEEQLEQCRAVARSVLLKPAGERHLGPALAALRGETTQEELFPGELPAPPKREAAPYRAPRTEPEEQDEPAIPPAEDEDEDDDERSEPEPSAGSGAGIHERGVSGRSADRARGSTAAADLHDLGDRRERSGVGARVGQGQLPPPERRQPVSGPRAGHRDAKLPLPITKPPPKRRAVRRKVDPLVSFERAVRRLLVEATRALRRNTKQGKKARR